MAAAAAPAHSPAIPTRRQAWPQRARGAPACAADPARPPTGGAAHARAAAAPPAAHGRRRPGRSGCRCRRPSARTRAPRRREPPWNGTPRRAAASTLDGGRPGTVQWAAGARRGFLTREQLRGIAKALELQRVAARVLEEHGGLLAHLALESDARLDAEACARGTQAAYQLMPLLPAQHDAETRHRHVLAIHFVVHGPTRARRRIQVRDQLMAEEVEVHPFGRTATLGTAEQPAIEGARLGEVAYGHRQMEGLQRHAVRAPPAS